mgnify:CR=1 FL=1
MAEALSFLREATGTLEKYMRLPTVRIAIPVPPW